MNGPDERIKVEFAKIKVEPPDDETDSSGQIDKCSICWSEPPMNAVRLSCSHVFCYLCIKSAAASTGCCALCRSEIDPSSDFGKVNLVGEPRLPQGSDDGYFWFYEGRRGWWLYDSETARELESAFQRDKKKVERLVAGQVYVISLKREKQYQKSDKTRTRRICRERLDLEDILGLAGIRDESILARLRQGRSTDEAQTEDLRF